MMDVVALGESLIDFTPAGQNELGMERFSCNPGGAPANVLAMNAKLGGKTAFIGKVGEDRFGHFLADTMQNVGIDLSGLVYTKEAHTTLAFVHLNASGDRSFSFFRNPGADILLRAEEIPQTLLSQCRVFHFGSVSLTDEPVRSATIAAAQEAKKQGAIISYDPNYRPALWQQESEAVEIMRSMCPLADLIKVSDEEMTLITGETSAAKGAQALLAFGASLVIITGGEKGCYFATPACSGFVPAYQVPVADTTGSGDAFVGALLYRLQNVPKAQLKALDEETLTEHIRFASAAGGLTATVRGAIPAMPTEAEILRCMEQTPVRTERLIL